jgi:sigma-B regulation protein RsbU (phosphoserine phosphatase)
LPEVNDFVKRVGEELNFSKTDTSSLKLAIEEVVVNVINYAYPQGEKGEIKIEATASAKAMRFKITDNGMPFAPTDAPDVDTSLSAEDRQIGGLGIFLVRQLMDTINYERIDGYNILTLTKKRNT